MMRNSILFTLLLAVAFHTWAQTDADKVRSTVTQNDIEAHIYFLASDELRGRATGSPEIDIAASYLANHLRRYGVQPAGDDGTYYQQVAFEKVTPPETIEVKLESLNLTDFINLKVSNTAFQGDAVYLGYGGEEDFKTIDVKGKLVLVQAGEEGASDMMSSYRAAMKKRKLAQEAGASALVEIISLSEAQLASMKHYFNESSIGLASEEGASEFIHLWGIQGGDSELSTKEHGTQNAVELTIEGIKHEKMPGRNVVGYLEGSDPELKDEFVVYSAHYDHVGVGKPNAEMDSIYNGARDNAVGTVTTFDIIFLVLYGDAFQ